jgi:hypothetical protein
MRRRALVAFVVLLGVLALSLSGALAQPSAINYSLILTKESATKKQLKLTNLGSTSIGSLGFKGTDFTITNIVAHPAKGSCSLDTGAIECTNLELGAQETLTIDLDVSGSGGTGLYEVSAGALVFFPATGNPLHEQAAPTAPGRAPKEQKLKVESAAGRRGNMLTYVLQNADTLPIFFFRLETPGLKVIKIGHASETGGGHLTCSMNPAYVECTGGLPVGQTAEVPLKISGSASTIVNHVHTSIVGGVEKSVSKRVPIDLVGDADLEVTTESGTIINVVNHGPKAALYELEVIVHDPAYVVGDGFARYLGGNETRPAQQRACHPGNAAKKFDICSKSGPLVLQPNERRSWSVRANYGPIDATATVIPPTVDPNLKNNHAHK